MEINCLERSRVKGQDRSRYLFQTGRDTPATGLHGAVLPAHVLAHLPVLLSTLLSASTERRIAEERRNTITGQSTGWREREREQSAKERENQPASRGQKEMPDTLRDVRMLYFIYIYAFGRCYLMLMEGEANRFKKEHLIYICWYELCTMCFQICTITTNTRRARAVRWRQANPNNLRTVPLSSTTLLSVPIGLWNCQSAVNKAVFIPSIATHSGLNLMALTETWIKPEDTATPAALSTNFTFSHTPRTIGRGGGTGLLISNEWKFELLPSPTGNSSFESHAITITHPAKIHVVVVYRPPGQLGDFLEELDVLLSNFPEDGTPLVLLGDFNIHLEKPQATDFNTLLTSFDLKRVSTTATHKSGNRLDLIYTRYCSTDNTLVTPLHTSDHFLITSNLTLTPNIAHAPSQVTFRRNLRSLSPSRLSSMVSSALPSPSQFSALDTNSATDTLCSTLTSCLDNFCPLSSRPARTTPLCPLVVRCSPWTSY